MPGRLWFGGLPLLVLLLLVVVLHASSAYAVQPDTIARVKASVVGVGTFEPTRSPQFRFLGTGFAVGDGDLVATNAHVLPEKLDAQRRERLVVLVPGAGANAQVREVQVLRSDPAHDLALLSLPGPRLPALPLRESAVREGELYLFTGFPIGAVLGPYAASHRAMVSALTPIVIPKMHSSQLDTRQIRQLASGPFEVYQLDATAYPGNSGSPLYDPATGEVVGVINMVFVKSSKESVLKDPSGITYAIPVRHLKALLRQ